MNVWLDKLNKRIEEQKGSEFNIERMFTWFTFDVMGVLSFGEDFGCLENERNHPYLHAAEVGAPFLSVMQVLLRFPRHQGLLQLGPAPPVDGLVEQLAGHVRLDGRAVARHGR